MVSPVSLRSQAWILMAVVLVGLPAAPTATAEAPQLGLAPTSHSTLFQGAAIDWVWMVRGDATLEDGSHVDTGVLQAAVECIQDGRCTYEFTFVGGLGTATCSQTGGVLTGHMELYAGPSFNCASMALHIVGNGACEVSLSARGIDMGVHRLAGNGGGVGACVSPE